MKFSTKATYGLKAVLYLADHYGESAVSVSQIAEEENISAPYLEQILHRLKKASLVKSVRGPHGGYALSVKPSDVSVGEVFTALGEDVRVAEENVLSSKHKRKRPAAHNAADLFWQRLSTGLAKSLNSISIAQLLSGPTHAKSQNPELMFSI